MSEAIRQLLLRVADEKQLPFTWRRVGLPQRIMHWSLMSLQHRLVKTGGPLVKHARYYLVTFGRGASPPAAVQRHVAQALGAAPAGRREGNRLTDIWRRDGDERGSVGNMFPKNGSGVDAAGDCGAWELDERATKQSGHAERGWVYKGPDAGGQHGNSG